MFVQVTSYNAHRHMRRCSFLHLENEVSEEMMSVEDSSDRRRLRSLKLFEGAAESASQLSSLIAKAAVHLVEAEIL